MSLKSRRNTQREHPGPRDTLGGILEHDNAPPEPTKCFYVRNSYSTLPKWKRVFSKNGLNLQDIFKTIFNPIFGNHAWHKRSRNQFFEDHKKTRSPVPYPKLLWTPFLPQGNDKSHNTTMGEGGAMSGGFKNSLVVWMQTGLRRISKHFTTWIFSKMSWCHRER